MTDTCIFVSSSDNTFDVFSLVSGNIVEKWSNEALDLFVGLNKNIAQPPFQTISAPVSSWRTELEYQINALPEKFRYIILILDDFYFFEKVDLNKLTHFVNIVRARHIDYLRLKPLERSGLGKIFLFLRSLIDNKDGIIQLGASEPYYSSLQVAIWDRTHLSKMLSQNGSIWEFEHKVINGSSCYAINQKFLKYEHLVEKGRWFKHAPNLLNCFDHDSFTKRGFEQSLFNHSKTCNRVKFFLFGYVFFRYRRMIKPRSRDTS
jgi:hypothetical protein